MNKENCKPCEAIPAWKPKQIAPKRGSAWYILAVRNARKEVLDIYLFVDEQLPGRRGPHGLRRKPIITKENPHEQSS